MGAATSGATGGRALLTARDLTVRRPGMTRPALRGLELDVGPGRVVAVCGRSGTGKTSLLHALSGLVPWHHGGEVNGRLELGGEALGELDPGQRAHLLGTCLDRPEAQLFLATVGHELAAARRLYGSDAAADSAAAALAIDGLRGRRISELSSGQRQRVALAAALAAGRRPVLLDEPTAHLDGDGAAALGRLLAEHASAGGSVVLAEQAGWRVGEVVNDWLRLDRGTLMGCQPTEPPAFGRPAPPGDEIVLSATDLVIRRGGQVLVQDAALELRAGEVLLLSGANGVGKSTLGRVLAGVRGGAAGRVRRPEPTALMLPSAELQLFARTVLGEVTTGGVSAAEAAKVLSRHRLEHLAARAPWTLSRGERQRLVHAALDLRRPRLMIIDEPGQGLDPVDLAALIHLIHRRAEKGRAYLLISHRLEILSAVHRHMRIADRALEEVSA